MKKARPWLGPGLFVVKRAAATPQSQHTFGVGNERCCEGGCRAIVGRAIDGCGIDGCGIDCGIDDDNDDGDNDDIDDDGIDDDNDDTDARCDDCDTDAFFARVCAAIGASHVSSTRQPLITLPRTPS